jgi:hypothetical protein
MKVVINVKEPLHTTKQIIISNNQVRVNTVIYYRNVRRSVIYEMLLVWFLDDDSVVGDEEDPDFIVLVFSRR